MAISLKKLYLLNEYWTTTDFTHPETGEKETAQHWEPSSGYKLYRAPNIDVTKRAASDTKVREKSTQIFYDFYAMELLHALVGSSKEMSAGAKMKATLPTAARSGINPAMIGIDWDNVEFPLGNVVLPEKLRSQIDTMYEEVTIALSNKLQEHLRRSLIQELRHLINHSTPWQSFRNDIITHYNKTGTLTKEDLAKFVGKRIPGMSKHLDAVKRLLLFSRHYSKMGSDDPGDIATKDDPKPSKEKDDPSKYYDIEKDPEAVDISKKKEDEPDEEESGEELPDYPGWEPEAGTSDFDPEDPFNKKIKKQWKDKLKEDYASGKISPSTIRTINKAINKAGVKWEDIVLAYNNIGWNGGYGGEKWGEGVVSYLKLVQASKNQDIDKMASTIDHIYDLSHNNGPLLNKGGMYVAGEDLDRRSKITHIARFLSNVSPAVKQLVLNVMRLLPGTNVEVEKNIDTFLNAPTIPFSEEQKAKLVQYNIYQYSGDTFAGKASFTNKQGNYVDRNFFVKAHTNGKFTIGDSLKADSKVFDTFDQMDQYLRDVISKEVTPKSGGSSASPPVTTMASEIASYINSHDRIKLPSDKAQQLFDQCKMGWREKGQYYKAYFPGSKRAMFYAFSDGTYLAVTTEYNSFYPISNWEVILEFTKKLTANAIPYPEPEKAKAHIASGTSTAPIVAPTAATPPSTPITPQPETPKASVTPTAYPSVANQLPPNAASSAAYAVHSGISSSPTKTIRLAKPDEDAIINIGFNPKLITGMVWYIHKGTGDTVKFFPNNTAKLLFTSTGGGKSSSPAITFAIPKMLQWLQQKYTNDTKTSPISAPTPKPSAPDTSTAAPAVKGINPGALFNPQIQAAGFTWDQASGTYFDGQNSLIIKPDRSSLLIFGDGKMKQSKNLPELIVYLSDEYPTQKKTNTVNDPNSISDFQFEWIKNSIAQFPNWKAEKYSNTVLVKTLEPHTKTYVTKYGISKNDNDYNLYNASLGTVIDTSDLFGVIISTLISQINTQSTASSSQPANPLYNPSGPAFPVVSHEHNTFTTEELKYIDTLVNSYGGHTNYNEHYISIVPPANGNPLKGAKYYINKKDGHYKIIKTVGEEVLFQSPGFYGLTEKLKQILAEEGGTGVTPVPAPDKPSPSGGGESPNPNYQATANEIIAEVAHAINMTPESVATTKSFEHSQYTIPVIKAIRTFYSNNNLDHGLGCAKLAAYHWEDFLTYVRDHGLPPMKDGGVPEFEKDVVGYKSKKNPPSIIPTLDELVSHLSNSTGLTSDAVLNNHLGNGSTETKVSAIKTFRNFYKKHGMGSSLAHAKTAIEHWPNFLAYVKDTGSFPYMGTPFFDKAIGYWPSKSSSSTIGLIDDEKDWITTFFNNNHPHLEVDIAPDGMIYINQPNPNVINEITKGYKTLFIIYKGSPTRYMFRTMAGEEKAFTSFSDLASFISTSIGALIPPAQKTPQQKTWDTALENDYNGSNLEGLDIANKLAHNGFGWSEKNGAYINNNLHQFVVIKPQIGFNGFHTFWINKNGVLNAIKTNDSAEMFSAIGPRGHIVKDENEIKAGTGKGSVYSNPHSPNSSQEDLLTKMGFVKNKTQTSSDDPIGYTKPSDDSGNAYFTIDIDPYTGKTDYAEVDEGGTSEGYSYETLGHALSFLKNKFANELDDYQAKTKDDNAEDSTYDSDAIEYITDALATVGFLYKNTSGDIYEFFTEDGSEYVGYNMVNGKVTYGTSSVSGVYDIVNSFYDVDDFVEFYDSDLSDKKQLKILEKFGFEKTGNVQSVIIWKKQSQNTDVHDYYVSYFEKSKAVKYEVVNPETEETVLSTHFDNVKTALEYLKYKFEFNPPENVPYSGADYKVSFIGLSPYETKRLNTFDESTLGDMGFEYFPQLFIGNTKMGDPVYIQGYNTINGRRLIIYGDGSAVYQATETDPGMKFDSIKAALQYLWKGTNWVEISDLKKNIIKWKLSARPEPPAKSGDMPYSGYNYSLLTTLFNQAPNQTILLANSDSETMQKMGFTSQSADTKDIAFKLFYAKGNEKVYFFSSGRAAYWNGDDGPHYFNTVKDVMKFLWNKHTPYIEEVASYKSFMKNWLE